MFLVLTLVYPMYEYKNNGHGNNPTLSTLAGTKIHRIVFKEISQLISFNGTAKHGTGMTLGEVDHCANHPFLYTKHAIDCI